MNAPDATPVPIVMDARMLGAGRTGVASYARGLREALALTGASPLLLTDRYADRSADRLRVEQVARWLRTRVAQTTQMRRKGHLLLAPDIFRRAQVHFDRHNRPLRLAAPGIAPGIMHWTYPVPIQLAGWINIYTVHDVIPLDHPELTSVDPARHRRLLGVVGQAASLILTVSGSARAAILASGATGATPVVDAGQAVAPSIPYGKLPDGLVARGYYLACGAVEPRKNTLAVFEAWRRSGSKLPLVVAGPDGWRADHFADALTDPRVIRLRDVSGELMTLLQGRARALLFPSLAEGFGLPIVEAMALGTPVLTSRGGATEEVAGCAALLVEPSDVQAMATAIRRLDDDDKLCRDLSEAGVLRAGTFSFAAFAARLDRVHRGLIANRRVRH